MSETSWQERRDFERRLNEGQYLTARETQLLIEDVDSGERSAAILEGLQLSLKSQFGIVLVDATTDDDADGDIRIELIQDEDHEPVGPPQNLGGPALERDAELVRRATSDEQDQTELDSIGE